MDLTQLALATVIKAREAILRLDDSGRTVTNVGAQGREITTRADLTSHELCLGQLSQSGLPVISEESKDSDSPQPAGLRWILDPLDGTVNYARSSGPSAVSLALFDGDLPVFGIVARLDADETFLGGPGLPSTCNGATIRVSATVNTRRATLMTGSPTARLTLPPAPRLSLDEAARRYAKVRMIGSAAVSLCMVARGSADIYWEEAIRLWDVAAGLAILLGADGRVTHDGRHPEPLNVTGSNGHLGFPWDTPDETHRPPRPPTALHNGPVPADRSAMGDSPHSGPQTTVL